MTFRQFLTILHARWKLASGMLLLAIGVAVAIALLLPRQYTATASIVLDVRSPDPIAGVLSPALASAAYTSTQVDIIESERVALRVVRTLKMTENPSMRVLWEEGTGSAGSFEVWLANLLLRSLDVKPSHESNILQVNFKSVDPRFSAVVANAFVKAYIDTTLELRVDPARQYANFFDGRAKELLGEVEKAQARLSAYQKEHGILGNDERLDVETARLSELSSQLVGLQSLTADGRSRTAAARSNPDQLQDVLSNPVVSGLRTELTRQDARLQELTTRYADQHPQVIELRASIADLKANLARETARLSGSVGVSSGINHAREAEVRTALEAQRGLVLRMKEQRDEMAVLQRELEHATRAYDGVMTRLNQTSLESQSTQTNAAVLVPATEPPKPSSPQRVLIVLVGIGTGFLLAVASALLAESVDRRVRTVDDISRDLGLPALGRMLGKEGRTWFGRRKRHLLPPRILGRLPKLASR